MATSGTYSFLMSRDDMIGAALRLTQYYGQDDVIPAGDITNVALALNVLCKQLATEGLPLWCVKDYSLPMVANQSTYNLSTLTTNTLPLRILDLYIRDATANDTTLTMVSRYDYDTLGQKASSGVPNQAYYDPQLSGGLLTLFNVPADATRTLHVVVQRQIQDVNLSTDNVDFPQEAYRFLKFCLADDISLEYQCPKDVRDDLAIKAKLLKDQFFASVQEQVSVMFTPSERRR
jgi:hypothetical protein